MLREDDEENDGVVYLAPWLFNILELNQGAPVGIFCTLMFASGEHVEVLRGSSWQPASIKSWQVGEQSFVLSDGGEAPTSQLRKLADHMWQ